MRLVQRSPWRATPAMLLAVAAGCHHDCITTPCPAPVAATITLVSAVTGAAVPGGTIAVNGDTLNVAPCNDGTCTIFGSAGKYVLSIRAPGFAPVQQTLNVTGVNRSGSVFGPDGYEGKSCGCDAVNRQELTVRLTPAS